MREWIKRGYIGNPAQLCSVRKVELREGRGKGTGIIEVATADGLALDILPDTGLDLGRAVYKGVNMAWMSKNGYDGPAAFLPYETEFVNTFPGGLLYTCGLRSAGPANRDGDEWHPLHGRYHGLQAEHISTDIENDEIIIKGTIRETALFGHALELKRTITIPVFGASVTVHDAVTNLTPRDEEYMQIYHCNFGYPLLSEKAKLILPQERETIPRTDFAKEKLGQECTFDAPISNEDERVYFHRMKECRAILQNPNLGVAMTLSWSGETLPILAQWRMMGSGEYVLGLEPTNCYIMGRSAERENGSIKVLKPFETIENTVEINFSMMEE